MSVIDPHFSKTHPEDNSAVVGPSPSRRVAR
jgi:hypothetical protein